MKARVLALLAAFSCVADVVPYASVPEHYLRKRRSPIEAPTESGVEAGVSLAGSFREPAAALTEMGVKRLQELAKERTPHSSEHEMRSRRSVGRYSRSIAHLPHVSVTVRYPQSPANILIPLGHDMTTYGALTDAETLYSYRHPTHDNPFVHRLEKLENVPCWGIASFGDVDGGEGGSRWHIRVTDQRAATVLHDSYCLPRGSALKMRSHFLVEFYKPSSS